MTTATLANIAPGFANVIVGGRRIGSVERVHIFTGQKDQNCTPKERTAWSGVLASTGTTVLVSAEHQVPGSAIWTCPTRSAAVAALVNAVAA